jgi:uncharacterized protein YjbJ (UPF0337 family)
MSDTTRERVEGKVDETKGNAKSAVGNLTGDNSTKAEGELDKTIGKVKQGMADLKDKAEDALDHLRRDDREVRDDDKVSNS